MYNMLNSISFVNLYTELATVIRLAVVVVFFFFFFLIWHPDVYNYHNNNGCQRLPHLEVAPVVVGALGVVSNRLDAWLEKLGVTIRTGLLQKTALLGTGRILW